MQKLFAFDCDGVLRDESVSYQRCVTETVAFFSEGRAATKEELVESMKVSNDDWDRTHKIILGRGVSVDFEKVKGHFQDLYLGKERNFSGYINDEPWLVDNSLLAKLAEIYELVIVSGAPREEISYTLERNRASGYFKLILGMHDCKGKGDGLRQVIERFNPKDILFCDDRPSPIKETKNIEGVRVFGIMPPNAGNEWGQVLMGAGAEEVFGNINDYCRYFIEEVH